MQLDLTGQSALVTGASRGIGKAIARALAMAGARVAVHYHRNHAAAKAVAAALPGGPHLVLGGDIADPAVPPALVEAAVQGLGGLQVLVNNAGVFEEHPPLDSDYDAWRDAWQRTLGANLFGPANLCHAAARHMATHGGGRIINVSSRGAFRGEPDAPAYGASKAGLNAMSQSLAKALAPHGVFVYAVAPGWVETDMGADYLAGPGGDAIRGQSPLNRVARPEEVARTVLFLATPGAEFLTGGIIDINGASYLRT